MPVVRVCAHCKKSMIASTYQLMDHVFNKCPVYKENVKKKSVEVFIDNKKLLNKGQPINKLIKKD